jgi:hypothetical protein
MMSHHSDTPAPNVSSIKDTNSLWLAKTLDGYEVEEIELRELGHYLAIHPLLSKWEAATGSYDDW